MDLGFRGWVPAERSRFVLLVVSALGLSCDTRPKFMMDDCFGLAHESIRLGLGLEPRPNSCV